MDSGKNSFPVHDRLRPNARDYITMIFTDVVELAGDRLYGDDPAVMGALGRLGGRPVTIIGQIRGRTLAENMACRFSMAMPEGYRKVLRLMKQAEKFHRPVICFIDTVGAFPGISAEERGQGAAIAQLMKGMLALRTPLISVLIGEGGSGGAAALCAADELAVLEYATLSVISPKACAEILWKDETKAQQAADFMKITAADLCSMGVADVFLPEPPGGAQACPKKMADEISRYLLQAVRTYAGRPGWMLAWQRNRKYRKMGERIEK